jgi:hypothetical protein
VIKLVSDLQQVSGFLWALVSSANKTNRHNITEKLLKVVLNTLTPPLVYMYYKEGFFLTHDHDGPC